MKLLIVKTSSLGDIIQTFPVVVYLRKKFPDASIDWVVEKPFAELVEAHPYIDRVLKVDTKSWRKGRALQDMRAFRRQLKQEHYDVVFDLQGNIKSGLITWQARASAKVGLGWKSVPEWPNMLFTHQRFDLPAGQNIREDYLFLVQSHFGDLHSFEDAGVRLKMTGEQKNFIQGLIKREQSQVMVCPGSAWPNKQMTEEAFGEFLRLLQGHLKCAFIFVWGTQREKQQVERLQKVCVGPALIIDRQPLPVLQNLMNEMTLVVAMDSLPLHLAGTTSTSTYSVFGASLLEKYKPIGPQHSALQGSCPYKITFDKRCPKLRTCPTGLCIRGLTGAQVFQHFIASRS